MLRVLYGFFSPLSKLDLRKKFENRVWTNTESFSEYLYDKVILANKAKIDESELVDQLIEGIPDESLRDQAKMQRFKNKDELLKAFEKIKLNKKTTVANKSKESPKDSKGSKDQNKSQNDNQNKTGNKNSEKSSDKKKVQCYNCSAYGHIARTCRKERIPKGSCLICASMDHVIKDCLQNKKMSSDSEVTNIEKKSFSEFHSQISLCFESDGEQFEMNFIALLDSGSPISFIKSKFLNPDMIKLCKNNEYYGVNDSKLKIIGKTTPSCTLFGCTRVIELLVVDDSTMISSIILGQDAFKIFELGISTKQIEKSNINNNKFDDNSVNHTSANMNIEIIDSNGNYKVTCLITCLVTFQIIL